MTITEFLQIYDINDLTNETLTALSKRLSQNFEIDSKCDRYEMKKKTFL